MTRYRLNWKGILYSSEGLLFAGSEPSWVLTIPILLFLFFPKLIFSYLMVSDEGIELLYWPNYRLKSSWEELENLGKVTVIGSLTSDVLYLRGETGEANGVEIDRHRGIKEKRIIPLSDFRGWPKGQLYTDLLRFIPDIISRIE
ncbi:hypothetical protein KA005_13095 [bacterium]|nr:hypothetical protein [bacterium]